MASLGMNSWTGSSSIPSGRCKSSPSSGVTSTTTNAHTAPWAIALLLQKPSSPPLLQDQRLSVSHDLWYNYWGQVNLAIARSSLPDDCDQDDDDRGLLPPTFMDFDATGMHATWLLDEQDRVAT